MAETGSCVLAAGAAALASYGLGQVGVWALRLSTRSVGENLTLSAGLGLALGSASLALMSFLGALSVEVVELLTLGFAAVGVWGLAACWIRLRIAQTTSPWTSSAHAVPATARPVLTLGLLTAAAALLHALAPPLPGSDLATEICRSAESLRSSAARPLDVGEATLAAPLVLGGPGASSVFRWLLALFAAAAAGLAVELPQRRDREDRRAVRGVAVALALAAPVACVADQTAAGLLVGGWLALAWFAWRRSLCESAGARWRVLASVVGGAALICMALAMRRAPQPAAFPVVELFESLGPLLTTAAPVAILVVGLPHSSAAVMGMIVLGLGASSGVGSLAAAWAAPLLAASVAQGVSAFDGFRWPVRRWGAAAFAAALAVQAALPLVAARGVWAVALGREERDDYLGKRIPEFRAVRLLDALARRQALVYSDQSDLLYYDGPCPQQAPPAADWLPEELTRPVFLLHVDPPPSAAGAQRWLAARNLELADPLLTTLLDYEFDDGNGAARRYRLLQLAPEAARELAAGQYEAAQITADRRAADAEFPMR